uniref:Uncharacterized protein n=1 Tax=Cacopsylla melanoneura TaxID=428564 RepID=A0A8D8YRF9_9HEMI
MRSLSKQEYYLVWLMCLNHRGLWWDFAIHFLYSPAIEHYPDYYHYYSAHSTYLLREFGKSTSEHISLLGQELSRQSSCLLLSLLISLSILLSCLSLLLPLLALLNLDILVRVLCIELWLLYCN